MRGIFNCLAVLLLICSMAAGLPIVSGYSGVDVAGSDGWLPIMPNNDQFDYVDDQQTGSGSVSQDLVGNAAYRVFYVNYADNEIGFRFRIDNADGNSKDQFKNFAFVGVDADMDGGIDFFAGVYNPTGNNGRVGIYNSDPSKANTGPSTTGIDGILKSYIPVANANFSLKLTNDGSNFWGDADYFISFKVPVADINSAMASAGKSINITSSTLLRYIVGTAAQDNSFNQDLAGIEGIDTKDTRTWEELGVYTPFVTISGNLAPTAADASAVTNQNTPVSGSVGAADSDGDTLSYSIKAGAGPANGTALVDGSGAWTYTPSPDFTGSDGFVVVVDDGKGGVAEAAVTITVLAVPVNHVPTAADASAVTNQNTPVSGNIGAVDPDGDTLSYSIKAGAGPANGTALVDGSGTWTYTPSPDFTGSDGFVVVVDDGKGGVAEAAITLTVLAAPVNHVPTAADASAVTNQNTPVSGNIGAVDPDGDTLSYSIKAGAGPANGTALVDGSGAWTYTPSPDFTGSDGFVVVVDDGKGGVAEAAVTLTVLAAPVNHVPTAADASITVSEGIAASGTLTASDPDGDELTYSITAQGSKGTVTVNPLTGEYTYTPAPGQTGADAFTFKVNDGEADSNTATVNVTILANSPPAASDVSESFSGTKASGSVGAVDPDGDSLSYSIKAGAGPANGTALVDGAGIWTYTPNPDFTGSDSFIIVIVDGKGGSTEITITLSAAADTGIEDETLPVTGSNTNLVLVFGLMAALAGLLLLILSNRVKLQH